MAGLCCQLKTRSISVQAIYANLVTNLLCEFLNLVTAFARCSLAEESTVRLVANDIHAPCSKPILENEPYKIQCNSPWSLNLNFHAKIPSCLDKETQFV